MKKQTMSNKQSSFTSSDGNGLKIEVTGPSNEFFGNDLHLRAILHLIEMYDTKPVLESDNGFERLEKEMEQVKQAVEDWMSI